MAGSSKEHGHRWARRGAPRARAAAAVVAAMTVVAGAVLPVVAVPAAAADGCVPVAVLAFRGSGEKNIKESVTQQSGESHRYGGSELVTNGWEGPTLERLFARFATIEDGSFQADRVPVIGVGPADEGSDEGYPAVEAWRDLLWQLIPSAEDGVAAAQATITRFKGTYSRGCAQPTKFIAVGYSQGAMAARMLAQQNTTDVVGVVDLGDPYQKGSSPGTTGTGAAGNGYMRWNYPWFQSRWDKFYELDIHKSAVCHKDDPICDFHWGVADNLARKDVPEHLNYMKDANAGEGRVKAQELADLARRITREATDATPPSAPPADVVFAIDTTGSMGPYIDQARATAQAAAEATLEASSGSRVGLVEYRDHGDAFVSRTVVPLTTDYDQLTGGLTSLVPEGGGDWPEAVYSGIVNAAQLDFRSAAVRSIVVIGDAPAHDPEPVTGYTATSVVARLGGTPFADARVAAAAPVQSSADETAVGSAQDPAPGAPATSAAPGISDVVVAPAAVEEPTALPLVLYSLSASSELSDQLDPVVAATGGLAFDLTDAEGVSSALTAALEDTLAAPVAQLGTSPAATVGVETSVAAVGSTAGDPDLTYEFDLDGDGTYEVASDTAVARVTFTEAGAHPVGVRVSDTRGRSDTATAVVDVAPSEALVPLVDFDHPTVALTVAPLAVPAGQRLTVAATGVDLTGASLLLVPGDDPWGSDPAFVLEPLPEGWQTDGVLVPSTLPEGRYQVVLGTVSGRWGATGLTVLPSEPPVPAPTATPDPVAAPPAAGAPDGATAVVNHPVRTGSAPATRASERRLASTGADGGTYGVVLLVAAALAGAGFALRRLAGARRHG